MSFFSKHKFLFLVMIIFFLVVLVIAFLFTSPMSASINSNWSRLQFDVKLLRLNTNIDVYENHQKIGVVKGNIIRLITDPLTYYDVNGQKIAYADDTYHFIAQDSHTIVVDGVVTAEMVGKVKLIGEAYGIYNAEGQLIANAEFGIFNVNGKITDVNGTTIAVYKANPILQDFTLYISPDCSIDKETLIMICSSYYSDQAADSSDSDSSD